MDNAIPSLDQLRDVHLPPPPPEASFLPIYALALATVLVGLVVFARLRRRQSWKREALLELDRVGKLPDDRVLGETAMLVRRVALYLSNQPEIRRVTGDAWLERLDGIFLTHFFTDGPGAALGDCLYDRPSGDRDTTGNLIAGLRHILRKARVRQ